MKTTSIQAVSKETRDEATQDKALVRGLKLGLDVHYRQVTVAMQEDGGRIKAAGKMSHEAFLNWVRTKLEEGWRIDSCYEAGASGYWLHRELVALGVKNLVVAPKAMGGPEAKRQKTDKRDSGQLCDALDRYLRGQDKALSVVAVPTFVTFNALSGNGRHFEPGGSEKASGFNLRSSRLSARQRATARCEQKPVIF